MELKRSAKASIIDISLECLNEMLKEEYIPESWKDAYYKALMELVELNETAAFSLFMTTLLTVLDEECFEDFKAGLEIFNKETPKYNTINYLTLNAVDENIENSKNNLEN